ncbi:MAG: helix-turn-helix transcriptional regulator [Treponema sp.]|nr:helix-turn-helix transcriptional regulator [Treponema sp.]
MIVQASPFDSFGFANDSYFSKAFRKAYGVTPNSLRK